MRTVWYSKHDSEDKRAKYLAVELLPGGGGCASCGLCSVVFWHMKDAIVFCDPIETAWLGDELYTYFAVCGFGAL